ncbi:hypothetical protein ACN47E_009425 [Coniothyrium glycines]
MAQRPPRQGLPRGQRAYSNFSEDSLATPRPSPPATRRGTRAPQANSITSDANLNLEALQPASRLHLVAPHYFLPPTVPSPFTGTLEASLDAVLHWGTFYTGTRPITNALLQEPSPSTSWPSLLHALWLHTSMTTQQARAITEDLFFLTTRTLLPNQIAHNRAAMAHLYEHKKQLAIRLTLRYDMLREWTLDTTGPRDHPLAVPSVPPKGLPAPQPIQPDPHRYPRRAAQLPNVLATLIAAPPGGFSTHGVRERMKHHVTELDGYLLLSDAVVAGWSDGVLLRTTSQVVLQWQWLRRNNETLEAMEVLGWEELEGRAEDCEWIADDVRKVGRGREGG